MSDEDRDDWAGVCADDEAALARLFDRHGDRLFRHASRLLSVREDAKDAVVIAFSELWRKRRSVRLVDGSPLPWLLNTVSNAARNLERTYDAPMEIIEHAGMPIVIDHYHGRDVVPLRPTGG